MTEPLTTVEHDIAGLDGFMLNTEKLMASELWALATGDEFKAAMGLWCRAWKQIPAGSLPNDERVLAAFSGAGKAWPKVRDVALRNFVLCSDGRLYHKTLCEDVHRAHAAKKERQNRTKAATEARNAKRNEQRDVERDVEQTDNVTTSHRQEGKVTEEERKKEPTVLSKEKRGTRLPDDFEPDESCHQLAESLLLTTKESQDALDNFLDYWRAVPGSKGLKLNWQMTFKNQLRHVAKKAKPNGSHKAANTMADGFAKVRAVIAEAERREHENFGTVGEENAVSIPRLRQIAS